MMAVGGPAGDARPRGGPGGFPPAPWAVAGFVDVKVKRPYYRSGGGALTATINAQGGRAAEDIRAAVLEAAHRVVNRTRRKGWPIGPPRPWEPGHVHSITRFDVIDRSRGWYIKIDVTNAADYAQFIHAPGRPNENVVKREITVPLAAEIEKLRVQIPKLIKRALEGGR
jgi:hypothetical protein